MNTRNHKQPQLQKPAKTSSKAAGVKRTRWNKSRAITEFHEVTTMKTIITIAAACALVISLTACVNKPPANQPQPTAAQPRVICQQYTQLQPLGAKQDVAQPKKPAQACVAMR
jgi:predicted small lipoprotein YifL